MRSQPLRIPPGADLRQAVEALAASWPRGGFVVCGLGSLIDPCLRLAGQAMPTRYPGPHEILTLSGSFTAQGAHLHLSMADAQGRVLGGHVPHGNRVLTTVELLLAEPVGWQMGRAPDARTGFLELVSQPVPADGPSPAPAAPPGGDADGPAAGQAR
jgi:uncharacterized protein